MKTGEVLSVNECVDIEISQENKRFISYILYRRRTKICGFVPEQAQKNMANSPLVISDFIN